MNTVICPHNCKDCYAMRACAVSAITDDQGSIYIDRARCIGCGSCKTACTTFGSRTLRLSQLRSKRH